MQKVDASVKVGIVAGVGDRRDEDIIELGEEIGKVFDEIIIRQDRNLRGRTHEEIVDLLKKGIFNIDSSKKIKVILKESEAIEYAIKNAKKDAFITIISDVVPDALDQIMEYKEKDNMVL